MQKRRPSQIYRLERGAGRSIIGARRNNIAHVHRAPWRGAIILDSTTVAHHLSPEHARITSGRRLADPARHCARASDPPYRLSSPNFIFQLLEIRAMLHQ
jgi:hypothetical protein